MDCEFFVLFGVMWFALEVLIDHLIKFEFIAVDAMFYGSVDSGQ
jgi:hypothetical protein